MIARLVLPLLLLPTLSSAQLQPYLPTDQEVAENYKRSAELGYGARVLNNRLQVHWIGDQWLWYERDLTDGSEYVLVQTSSGKRRPLFDHGKLVTALAKKFQVQVQPNNIQLDRLSVSNDLKEITFVRDGKLYVCDLASYEIKEAKPAEKLESSSGRQASLPFKARIINGNLEVSPASVDEWQRVSTEEGMNSYFWSPDGKFLVGIKVIPGDRKTVSTLQSNVKGATRSKLVTRMYDQPGDKLDTSEYFVYSPVAKWKENKLNLGTVINGGYPWASSPRPRWWRPDGATEYTFLLDILRRGYQALDVVRVDGTGKTTFPIRENSSTFVDTGDFDFRPLQKQDALIVLSESDGWNHLYKVDGKTGKRTQITKGEFVVRSIVRINEGDQRIIFSANGREKGDPYFIHYYRVDFDGKNLTRLTEGEGTHSLDWSPNNLFYVDSYSSTVLAPVFELRSVDGKLISTLERADASQLSDAGVPRPKPFVAKGRDGKTDIWGVIYFPSQMDKGKKYPIIENIYAGPHDSHVPKAFSAVSYNQRIAELGFVVVQIDGMGTDNRGKAFHDVCWKNIADAGFPDRIAWMKAANKVYPQMDIDRVGIFGTSAGGQNSAGAVLFHPEFYDVAVSSCGCHDNRIDKFWWNEQWMGYPVGDHYAEQSNITNASKLQGSLMLIVGEVDSNVPPESTYRFAAALIEADKEFELVVIPGADHTSGGSYGERKRRDFFVRHLLGANPPLSNRDD